MIPCPLRVRLWSASLVLRVFGAGTAGTRALAGRQIDITHASAANPKTVPGSGDAYAAKIIAGRP